MDYTQSAALMMDTAFRGRVKVAALKFAVSIEGEAPTVPSHNARLRWAQLMYQQPDMMATQLQPPVVMDPGVQNAGSAIDDAGLQASVEAVVNQFI